METASSIRRSQPIRSIFWCAFMVSFVGPRAAGQEADPLQQMQRQLEQLKQQYAETARAFEQRIAVLEQQLEKQKEAEPKQRRGRSRRRNWPRKQPRRQPCGNQRPGLSIRAKYLQSRRMTTSRRLTRKSRTSSKRPPILNSMDIFVPDTV